MKFHFQKLMILVFVLAFSTCKKDDSKEATIVGSWLITKICQLDNNGQTFNCTPVNQTICIGEPDDGDYFIFNSDGTYQDNFSTCNGSGVYSCTDYEEGTWEIVGDQFSLSATQEFDCNSGDFDPLVEDGTATIVSCDENSIVLNDEEDPNDKYQVTFTRQ